MCGIVGFVGDKSAQDVLIKGLEKLEYRGYDSAGIYVVDDQGVGHLFKEQGRIKDLEKKIDFDIPAHIGIGHTRWATHGEPSVRNAHPHQSHDGRFTLVHNGVIENYKEIKEKFLSHVTFKSDTDTEVIVELIAYFYNKGIGTVKEAFCSALNELEGSYALGLIDIDNPEVILAAKNKSPMLVAKGDDFNAITSDAMATVAITSDYIEIQDGEIVEITKDTIVIEKTDGTSVQRESYKAQIDANDLEKGTYPFYMAKEIDEQPAGIRNIIQAYSDEAGNLTVDEAIVNAVKNSDRVFIIAAGTSMHAGMVAMNFIEKVAGIPTEVHVASEFSYNVPLLPENPFFIFITQSGETADSRQVLVYANEHHYPSLTITNVAGSTLSREATYTMLLHVGPEIAVASTKAYTGQIAVLSILADAVARAKQRDVAFDLKRELSLVAEAMDQIMENKEHYQELAHAYFSETRNAFYIGRGLDYYVSLEAALKLKEISYIQTEGFAAGELKHGTISLIEDGVPVVAIITQANTAGLTRGNTEEVRSRGAKTLTIAMEEFAREGDEIVIPNSHPLFTPLLSVLPGQLLAYYATIDRGLDVDKPRNLAKSVTVE